MCVRLINIHRRVKSNNFYLNPKKKKNIPLSVFYYGRSQKHKNIRCEKYDIRIEYFNHITRFSTRMLRDLVTRDSVA